MKFSSMVQVPVGVRSSRPTGTLRQPSRFSPATISATLGVKLTTSPSTAVVNRSGVACGACWNLGSRPRAVSLSMLPPKAFQTGSTA